MERHPDAVVAHLPRHHGARLDAAAAGDDVDHLAVLDPQPAGVLRVDLDEALGLLGRQALGAARLGGGVVVVEGAAGREHQRVLLVLDLERRAELDRLEETLAAQHSALVQVLGRRRVG